MLSTFGRSRLNVVIAMRLDAPPLAPRGPARFLPPVLWMGVIAIGSSGFLSGDRTGQWMLTLLGHLAPGANPGLLEIAHLGMRKVAHLVEFGALAILWHRALSPSRYAMPVAFVLATVYGGVDELRQGLVPNRVPALSDVMVDSLGALLGLAVWTEPGPLPHATRRVAIWGVGLLAGLAALGFALDSALGRPAMDVGLAALGLGLVANGLAWLGRSPAAEGPRSRGAP
jgi:VanZ like family